MVKCVLCDPGNYFAHCIFYKRVWRPAWPVEEEGNCFAFHESVSRPQVKVIEGLVAAGPVPMGTLQRHLS